MLFKGDHTTTCNKFMKSINYSGRAPFSPFRQHAIFTQVIFYYFPFQLFYNWSRYSITCEPQNQVCIVSLDTKKNTQSWPSKVIITISLMIGSQPSYDVQSFPTFKFTQFTSRRSFWNEDSLLSHQVISCQGLGNRGPWKDGQNYSSLLQEHILADLTCTLLVSIFVSDGDF